MEFRTVECSTSMSLGSLLNAVGYRYDKGSKPFDDIGSALQDGIARLSVSEEQGVQTIRLEALENKAKRPPG